MTDTVTRLMALADAYADACFDQALARQNHDERPEEKRQALHDELTRLFTPLSDEQIKQACKETWVFDTVKQWARSIEAAHGIGEAK